MDDIAALVRDGKLKPMLDDESPFAFGDWRKMFEKQISQRAKGKLVMKVAEDGKEDNKAAEDMDTVMVDKVVELAPVMEEDDGKQQSESVQRFTIIKKVMCGIRPRTSLNALVSFM